MGEVHWRELFHEAVESGLCTGCAACVMACPRDALGYGDAYYPVQVGDGMVHDQCAIGDKGCDICTRACPRFRDLESDLDEVLFGRPRTENEVYGQVRLILLTRTTNAGILEVGQDGGLVSTLFCWGLETERIVRGVDLEKRFRWRGPFDAEPTLVTDRAGVLATAGSRYTYSPNPLAMAAADAAKLKQLARVGMSCQASINGSLSARKVNKYARKIALTIGLLCAKTFTYDGQKQVLTDRGIDIADRNMSSGCCRSVGSGFVADLGLVDPGVAG